MLRTVLRFSITFGLMALILTRIDFESIVAQVSESNMFLFSLATLCITGQIFFLNLRWHHLLNAGRYKIPFARSALINIAGYLANTLFVTSIGSIIAKSGLAVKEGTSLVFAILVTFVDRFLTMAALILFAVFSLPVLSGVLDSSTENMLAMSLFIIIGATILAFWLLRGGVFDNYIKSNRELSRFFVLIRIFTENPKLIMKVVCHSILAQAFFFLGTYTLSSGMAYEGSTLQFLALLPVLALISSLPISFGGWGVREGVFIYGLGIIGFSAESAFLLSVQVGLVTLIAPFIVALPYTFNKENNLFFFLQQSKKTTKTNE